MDEFLLGDGIKEEKNEEREKVEIMDLSLNLQRPVSN